MILISLFSSKKENNAHVIEVDSKWFKVSPSFMVGSVVISGILIALYTVFW